MVWFERPRDPQQQHGFELIGAMIRRRRLDLSWTQRQLQARSGIDQAVISRLENGKQYGLRWARFAELVEALGGLDVTAGVRRLPPREAAWPTDDDLAGIDNPRAAIDHAQPGVDREQPGISNDRAPIVNDPAPITNDRARIANDRTRIERDRADPDDDRGVPRPRRRIDLSEGLDDWSFD